jgi:hypothetical protein
LGAGHANYAARRKVSVSRLDEIKFSFSIYLILPATLGLVVHATSNRNEYPKQNNIVSGE